MKIYMVRYTHLCYLLLFLMTGMAYSQNQSGNKDFAANSMNSMMMIDAHTSDSLSPKEKEWKSLLDSFPPHHPGLSDEAKKQIIGRFFSLNTKEIPPEWRFEFDDLKLYYYQINGKWNEMIAMRDELMSPKDYIPSRSPLDADLLFKIASYFGNTTFFPPAGTPNTETNEAKMDYWIIHYRNTIEAQKIYQYIVDHFDPNYVKTIVSLHHLLHYQYINKKYEKALDNCKKYERLDWKKAVGAKRYDHGSKRMMTDKEQLEEEKLYFESTKKELPKEMVKIACHLPTALDEFKIISEKYKDRKDVQEYIKKNTDEFKKKIKPNPVAENCIKDVLKGCLLKF